MSFVKEFFNTLVIGTTAVAVALTAYANLLTHWRAGTVRWKQAMIFALPGVIGAAVGLVQRDIYVQLTFYGKDNPFANVCTMVGYSF